jgi:hypothetical protein
MAAAAARAVREAMDGAEGADDDGGAPALTEAATALALLSPRLSPSRPAAFGGAGAPMAALRDGAAAVAELVRARRGGTSDAPLGPPPSTPADATAAVLASTLLDVLADAAGEGGVAPVCGLAGQIAAALRGGREGGAAVAPAVESECVRVLAWCVWICGVDF